MQTQCKFEDAAALYDAVLRGLSSSARDHAYDAACVFNNLAQIHSSRCDYVTAEKLSKLSLQILESAIEPDVELLALLQSNIGAVLQEQCKYEEAETFHSKAMANLKSLDEPSVHSYIVQNNMGLFFQKTGNYVDALHYYNAALGSIDTGNRYYPIILNNIGTIAELGGNTAAAGQVYRRVLQLGRNGGEDRYTIEAYVSLARCLLQDGSLLEAEQQLKLAHTLALGLFGDNHLLIAVIHERQGDLNCLREDFDLALDSYEQALSVQLQLHSELRSDHLGLLFRLASVYQHRMQYEKAIAFYRQAVFSRSS